LAVSHWKTLLWGFLADSGFYGKADAGSSYFDFLPNRFQTANSGGVMRLRLVQRRTIWLPTWLGLFCLALFFAIPLVWWCLCGESFLSFTDRLPAEVLVVEGWIGGNGVRAAAAEFQSGGYQYVVATGAKPDGDRGWQDPDWSFALGAANELARAGIPREKIILAPSKNSERARTFQSAVSVFQTLESLAIKPTSINVFTWGLHARRSRLVFAKVYNNRARVGVISWLPATRPSRAWWQSSEQAKDFLTESFGYLFEWMLNSGRWTSSPDGDAQRGHSRRLARSKNLSTLFAGAG
jgi:uncharacterized SAM-binding protein YcdF (DUF218 family)